MAKYTSRRFILAVLGGVFAIVNAVLEANGKPALDTAELIAALSVLASFILGESYRDGQEAARPTFWRDNP